jgi:hypothetical protein
VLDGIEPKHILALASNEQAAGAWVQRTVKKFRFVRSTISMCRSHRALTSSTLKYNGIVWDGGGYGALLGPPYVALLKRLALALHAAKMQFVFVIPVRKTDRERERER